MLIKYLLQMFNAIKTVLGERRYLISFIFLSAAIFMVIFAVQAGSIPGNSLEYQAKVMGYRDWLFFVFIAVSNALFIEMEIYIARIGKKQKINLLKGAAVSGIGTSAGILASIFGTATCSLCVLALFGFLGGNSVIFLVSHKNFIALTSAGFLIVALVLTSVRFNTACESCKVPPLKSKSPTGA